VRLRVNLDIRTAVYFMSLTGLLLAIGMTAVSTHYPERIRGTREWAIASWAIFVGFLLMFLRGKVHDFLSIPVANATAPCGSTSRCDTSRTSTSD
jgi:hypothetical protein